ncbi:hypothetical protein CVT25_003521 [Psilocybe cyanescens]|uniref:Protein kinase domain-containing protein n=1 Tax=Psilocybe cyanescens TaxID=93625 RepID=A0A409XQR0_PSICY|nr:hypothetical protein CVT25_003521 [Psilocybe cyanescens]
MFDELSVNGLVQGHIVYAQDTIGRHVAIKLVKGGSEEDKILHLLAAQLDLKPDNFSSIIPILELLPCNDHWFAIMPRSMGFYYLFASSTDILLGGATYDLREQNLLVNHFSNASMSSMKFNDFRWELLKRGDIRCTITDFDFLILLDEETYGPNPRLSILNANVGGDFPPYESMHGHIDYDPFKYDVALLGIHFCNRFQSIILRVPLLALLINCMVTSKLDKRFTVQEALAFADSIVPTVSPETKILKVAPVGTLLRSQVRITQCA